MPLPEKFFSAKMRQILVATALGLTMTGNGYSAETAAPLPTQDMFKQLSHERRALRIVAMPQIQDSKNKVRAIYSKNWIAGTPDGAARLENAINRYALLAVQLALLDDPARPQIIWSCNLPHDWYGVQWPGTGWGLDNPDNLYRYLFVDGSSRYEISGQRKGKGPVQQTFLLYSSIPGTALQTMEGAGVVSAIKDSQIHFAPDGSFKITVGPEPTAPGTDHLQSGPKAKVIFIRDTLNDWTTEFPNQLRVQRVAGPDAPQPRSDAEIAEKASSILEIITTYWLKFWQEMVYNNPVNTVPKPIGRPGGWGLLTNNWFKLQDDEALVVTMAPLEAHYLALQIADPWSITPDYSRFTTGLNKAQSKANNDGSYTFVISPHDPKVWNWVDTGGLHMGLLLLRWQELPDDPEAPEKAVREVKVVKLPDLKKMLPPETAWVTAAQRKTQLSARAASYGLRLAN